MDSFSKKGYTPIYPFLAPVFRSAPSPQGFSFAETFNSYISSFYDQYLPPALLDVSIITWYSGE